MKTLSVCHTVESIKRCNSTRMDLLTKLKELRLEGGDRFTGFSILLKEKNYVYSYTYMGHVDEGFIVAEDIHRWLSRPGRELVAVIAVDRNGAPLDMNSPCRM